MDDSWKKKYLKYKFKYNELKKMIGGIDEINSNTNNVNSNTNNVNPEINSIIVSHNGRLRCLINLFEKGLGNIKFKNCAILKLKISNTGSELSLIYSGSLAENSVEFESDSDLNDNDDEEDDKDEKDEDDEEDSVTENPIRNQFLNKNLSSAKSTSNIPIKGGGKKKYYVVDDTIDLKLNEIKFETKMTTNSNISKLFNIKPEDLDNKTFVFYLIRHGDGIHNKAKAEKKKGLFGPNLLDAQLTDEGKNQAVLAGRELKRIIKTSTIDHLFVSDLKRTRETLENILKEGIVLTNNQIDIIVLPCSHELDYKKGNCDGNQPNIFSSENKVGCISTNAVCNKSLTSNTDYCSNIKISNKYVLCINWNFYNLFYDNKNRSNLNVISKKFHCRDTSMISLALFIIKHPNNTDRNVMKKWIDDRKN